MKAIIVFMFLTLIISVSSCGQTPEQQKMIDDAMLKQDSIMNTQQVKDMMKQLQEEAKLNEEKKNHESKDKKSENKKSSDDWYWQNTIASTNDRFENWSNGTASICMMYRVLPGQNGPKTIKIGTINSDGSIQFDFPKNVVTQSQLIDRQNILFFDIQESASLNYTKGDTGYFANSSLIVIKNDKPIGTLTIGNSVRVTLNLVNQSNIYSGDEGYLLYWAYVEDDCTILANEDWKGEVRRDGTNTIEVETNVVYNLNFKKGWNLVKAEVIDKYELQHERGLDVSWFKNHKHTIIASMPDHAQYFFRTQMGY